MTSRTIEEVETVVVGGGQAGIAISEHLSNINGSHVVIERHRIAERWRTERWDSLVANGPAWHDRFPSMTFSDIHGDAFATKDQVVNYFNEYATRIEAPVRTGVEVLKVTKRLATRGYHVETSDGEWHASNIVAATGAFQRPVIPPIVKEAPEVLQLHSSSYHNPQQLPDGAVLVVGAGSSGTQIADELLREGREVYLSVGPHDRPPRRYRGRDFVWWLGVLGKWDAQAMAPGLEHVTIAVSGAHGGQTINFRQLAARGMHLLGRTESFARGVMNFANDLGSNLAHGDKNYLSVLDEADAYIAQQGLDLPEDPDARQPVPESECVTHPTSQLHLQDRSINTIIWATGYSVDYGWLDVDVFDSCGKPVHQRGVAAEPGIYFLGLPWQSRRGSSFIWGVWHDAKYLADHIATQRKYFEYHVSSTNNNI